MPTEFHAYPHLGLLLLLLPQSCPQVPRMQLPVARPVVCHVHMQCSNTGYICFSLKCSWLWLTNVLVQVVLQELKNRLSEHHNTLLDTTSTCTMTSGKAAIGKAAMVKYEVNAPPHSRGQKTERHSNNDISLSRGNY
jgi:hypothetical protein